MIDRLVGSLQVNSSKIQTELGWHPPFTVDAGLSETAAWFHHRLVFIHAFSNGNGRHARLLTDLLLIALKQPPFDWGAGDLVVAGEVRARYLDALRRADGRDYSLLRAFVRSGAASRSK